MSPLLVVTGRAAVGLAIACAVAGLAVVAVWDRSAVAIVTAIASLIQVPTAIVGSAAIRSAPRNVSSWLLLVGGTALPVATAAFLYGSAAFDHGAHLPAARWVAWFDGWPWVPALLAGALFLPLFFPDDRLPSRRWRPLLVLNVLLSAALLYATAFRTTLLDWDTVPNPTALPGVAGHVADGLIATILLVAPLTLASVIGFERKRRRAEPKIASVMGQVRWAAWLFPVAWWTCVALNVFVPALHEWVMPVETLGMSAIGITCWIAIRRYQLFDARAVVRRSVVYAGLSAAVLASYGLIALVLTSVGAEFAATPVALVVAVLVAVPLHRRLQELANRAVYGTREDPVATLLVLGEQLERAAATEDVLPAATRSLRHTLRLQHVAVLSGVGAAGGPAGGASEGGAGSPAGGLSGGELGVWVGGVSGGEAGGRFGAVPEGGVGGAGAGGGLVVAEDGDPRGGVSERLALIYAGEVAGTLVVTRGHDERPLDDERRAMLRSISRPIAAALRATSLARDLARSHESLVSATEEERRRLRRDLHDGLGPTLSSAVLGISRANALLVTRPDDASAQLEVLTELLQEAVADVRRLVYDLRPPALDHLGLVGALREHAEILGHFTVAGPEAFALPAATEVAAYRIAMEAMTNAVRHGGVRRGTVSISDVENAVEIVVTDDGVGLPDGYRVGVGITSMRERASELGGTLDLSAADSGGTKVRAWLPV